MLSQISKSAEGIGAQVVCLIYFFLSCGMIQEPLWGGFLQKCCVKQLRQSPVIKEGSQISKQGITFTRLGLGIGFFREERTLQLSVYLELRKKTKNNQTRKDDIIAGLYNQTKKFVSNSWQKTTGLLISQYKSRIFFLDSTQQNSKHM